jgi:hypothetical protein
MREYAESTLKRDAVGLRRLARIALGRARRESFAESTIKRDLVGARRTLRRQKEGDK